ncbi:MAG: hypothetical protein INR62_04345 [Rhodospirillales bacterium]|nr:hypothetical protein [Acetobacter sp.]
MRACWLPPLEHVRWVGVDELVEHWRSRVAIVLPIDQLRALPPMDERAGELYLIAGPTGLRPDQWRAMRGVAGATLVEVPTGIPWLADRLRLAARQQRQPAVP